MWCARAPMATIAADGCVAGGGLHARGRGDLVDRLRERIGDPGKLVVRDDKRRPEDELVGVESYTGFGYRRGEA